MRPRAVAMYLLRTEAGLRAEHVARLTGRDRATVLTVTRRVARHVHNGQASPTLDLVQRARAVLGDEESGATLRPNGRRPPADWRRAGSRQA